MPARDSKMAAPEGNRPGQTVANRYPSHPFLSRHFAVQGTELIFEKRSLPMTGLRFSMPLIAAALLARAMLVTLPRDFRDGNQPPVVE